MRHVTKVFQCDFPDTATFGGSLLDESLSITTQMETYCELALLLFLPFRTVEDLQLQGSFTHRFREAHRQGLLGEHAQIFLQNLQDCKSNSFRNKRVDDELQQTTHCFLPSYEAQDLQDEEEEHQEEVLDDGQLDAILNLLDAEMEENPNAGTDSQM